MKQSKLVDFLLMYEMPLWYEWLLADWMRELAAKYLAHSINTKLRRYEKRMELSKRESVIKKDYI